MALCARNVDMCLAHAPALSEQSLSLSKEICVAKTSVCVCVCVCVQGCELLGAFCLTEDL